jgi:isochorismate synthase
MALAGTRKMPESGDPADATWTAKEIEEHAFVVRDIIERFKEIRLREYEEFGPKAVAAGPVVHLKTDFVMDAILTDRASLADDLRQRLHPTSAVCGTPKRAAQELISRLESHDRQLYTGYWGPIGLDGGARLFVNLRCLRWFDNAVELYVGAGITRSSKPDREEEEIRLKANTLLSVLFESA